MTTFNSNINGDKIRRNYSRNKPNIGIHITIPTCAELEKFNSIS